MDMDAMRRRIDTMGPAIDDARAIARLSLRYTGQQTDRINGLEPGLERQASLLERLDNQVWNLRLIADPSSIPLPQTDRKSWRRRGWLR